LLCDELPNNDGCTAANVTKLRVMVCRSKPCTLEEANALSLDEVANVLETGSVKSETSTPTDATKGQPGRRGYPLKALDHALRLRKNNPTMKAHAIRLECLKHFSEDDLPPDGESFRRWLNRKRANRAN
jgi:hypothetical protein